MIGRRTGPGRAEYECGGALWGDTTASRPVVNPPRCWQGQNVPIAERYQATIPVPRAIRFPVELVPPDGFDPARIATVQNAAS